MSEVVTIQLRPFLALILAVAMSAQTAVGVAMIYDRVPVERHEVAIIILGWLWWATLLWLVTA